MARRSLTETKLRALLKAKPPERRYKLSDGEGLYLAVETNGSLYWRYKYRFGGQERLMALGQYDAIGLSAARDAHQAARRSLKAGVDPLAQRIATEKAAAGRKTFKEAADEWLKLLDKKSRAPKTKDRDERMVSYLCNAFGAKPVDEVKVKDLTGLLDAFEKSESYETRMRLQSAALNIMGFAQGKGWIDINPFLGIAYGKAFTAPTNEARPAVVEAKPFGTLMNDIATYHGRRANLVGKAIQLLALCWTRPGTVVNAEWDEFDLDKAMWTTPFAKLKQRRFREGIKELVGKPHYVPLSRQAVALLRDLKAITGGGRYVFPVIGRRKRKEGARRPSDATGIDSIGPVSVNALEIAIKSLGYEGRHCPHGFRSSASTLLNAERITVDGAELPRFQERAIEFQLEHVDKSMAAIYNRNQLLDERKIMMQFWADKIDALRKEASQKPDAAAA